MFLAFQLYSCEGHSNSIVLELKRNESGIHTDNHGFIFSGK